MKNIHVLPTEKPSRFKQNNITKKISLVKNKGIDLTAYTAINIYITSDETAYPYSLHLKNQEVLKINGVGEISGELYHDKGFSYPDQCKKIILTTDQELIKDGIKAIDDEFLEWFVKNPSCDFVRIGKGYFKNDYEQSLKIVIPKEEPKQYPDSLCNFCPLEKKGGYGVDGGYMAGCEGSKCDTAKENYDEHQETLEEAINNEINNIDINSSNLENIAKYNRIRGTLLSELKKSMTNIAKWQQERMYSEEEVLEHLNYLNTMSSSKLDLYTDDDEMITAKWFEQFKNK